MVSKFKIGVLVIILNSLVRLRTILGQDNPSLLQNGSSFIEYRFRNARAAGMGDMGAATLPDINSAVLGMPPNMLLWK